MKMKIVIRNKNKKYIYVFNFSTNFLHLTKAAFLNEQKI